MSDNTSYRLTIVYGQPDDPAAFDRYYRDVHIPLASKIPGLSGWTLNWLRPSPDGYEPTYHLVADLYSPTEQTMLDALNSPEGQAAAADTANFATGGVTFLHGNEEVVIPVGGRTRSND